MNSLIIFIILGLLSYAFDKVKESKQKEGRPQTKKIKRKVSKVKVPRNEQQQFSNFQSRPVQQTRVIVDREKEIYSNSQIIEKEKIVNDIIFSEILSKPKSKR